MSLSKIKNELYKLFFNAPLFRSESKPVWFNDLLYITSRAGTVKSYTVLKLKGITFAGDTTKYILADEFEHSCSVEREMICFYKWQNLKAQRVFDIVLLTLEIALMASILVLTDYFPKFLDRFLG